MYELKVCFIVLICILLFGPVLEGFIPYFHDPIPMYDFMIGPRPLTNKEKLKKSVKICNIITAFGSIKKMDKKNNEPDQFQAQMAAANNIYVVEIPIEPKVVPNSDQKVE